MMRNLTPGKLSIWLSSIISILVSIIVISIYSINHSFNLVFLALTLSSCFIFSYIVLTWGISQFIDKKVRLIYRTVHNLNLKKGTNKVDINEDVFSKIREEVIEWDKYNRQEIERLMDQEKFRREFIGNISHELKTPIFNIQGYILTLLEGGVDDKKINKSFLEKAEKSIDRMIEMVNDLDQISKLESNRIELNQKKINLGNLTKEVIDSLEYKAKKRNIKLKISSPLKTLYVIADPSKISQVFTNLIINSINYGNDGGETNIQFFDIGENVMVEIADNGKGIAEEHLPRLFERFYRIDKGRSRADGGSGLGLAIVKHIIEAHQQTINVRSKLDKGSAFSFTLKKA